MKRWPTTEDERGAAWDYVLSLRERCGDEASAVALAVKELGKGGVVLTAGELLACRPKRKGPDTHVEDIGREVLRHGVESMVVDGREVVEEGDGEQEAGDRTEDAAVAVEVLSALFRKILPALPEGKPKAAANLRYVVMPPGGSYDVVSDRLVKSGRVAEDFFAGVVDGHLMVHAMGQVVPVLRGAVRVMDAEGVTVAVYLNATVRGMWRPGAERREGRLRLIEWTPGKADWDFAFKLFVTYATMFCPGTLGHARASAVAALLGETRAAISARKKVVAEGYKEVTGGRAGFVGMRSKPDPRKGKKLGPRTRGQAGAVEDFPQMQGGPQIPSKDQ